MTVANHTTRGWTLAAAVRLAPRSVARALTNNTSTNEDLLTCTIAVAWIENWSRASLLVLARGELVRIANVAKRGLPAVLASASSRSKSTIVARLSTIGRAWTWCATIGTVVACSTIRARSTCPKSCGSGIHAGALAATGSSIVTYSVTTAGFAGTARALSITTWAEIAYAALVTRSIKLRSCPISAVRICIALAEEPIRMTRRSDTLSKLALVGTAGRQCSCACRNWCRCGWNHGCGQGQGFRHTV